MRKIIVSSARKLPPKVVSERLTVWVGLFGAALAAIWTLSTYSADIEVQRVAATLDFYHKYEQRFSASASPRSKQLKKFNDEAIAKVFQKRCQFIENAIESGKLVRQLNAGPTDCSRSDIKVIKDAYEPYNLSQKLRAEFRNEVATHLLALRSEHPVIDENLDFLAALSICVRKGNCEAATAVNVLFTPMNNVLNLTCQAPGKSLVKGGRRYHIARMLKQYNADRDIFADNTDAGRKSIFLCPELRQFEQEWQNSWFWFR